MKRAEEARIRRIESMEELLNECEKALSDYEAATDRFEAAQARISALSDYYGSGDWHDDREADEQGLLPQTLKRGVLSEDLAYDVITGNRDLAIRLLEIAARILKRI